MEQPASHTPTKTDITTEPYQGPGPTVASLGYGTIDWHVAWASALALGVGAALVAPRKLNALFNALQQTSTSWRGEGNLLQKASGWLMHGWLAAGKWSNQHLPGHVKLAEKLGEERWKAAATSGGAMTVLAFIGSFFTGTERGIRIASKGKEQFERAKEEIRDLRRENDSLRTKYTDLKLAPPTAPTSEAIADAPAQPDTTIRADSAALQEDRLPTPAPAAQKGH